MRKIIVTRRRRSHIRKTVECGAALNPFVTYALLALANCWHEESAVPGTELSGTELCVTS